MQPEVVNRKNVFLVIFEGFCYKDLPLHASESAAMLNFLLLYQVNMRVTLERAYAAVGTSRSLDDVAD